MKTPAWKIQSGKTSRARKSRTKTAKTKLCGQKKELRPDSQIGLARAPEIGQTNHRAAQQKHRRPGPNALTSGEGVNAEENSVM
jgi:hypothetical protein